MTNFLLIFCCLGVGIILQHKANINAKTMSHALNQYVIFVALPALVLAKMPFLQFSHDLIVPVLMPYLMVAFGAGMVLLGSRLYHWSVGVTGCLLLCVPLGNTSFLGIPMITAFFGEEFIQYGIIYDQLGSFIALSTFGTFVLAKYQQHHKATACEVIKNIFTFPAFIGLVVSLILRIIPYPPFLVICFEHIGHSLVPCPCSNGSSGTITQNKIARPLCCSVLPWLTNKINSGPLLALSVIKGLNLNHDAAIIAVFEAGMPPMVTGGALALAAGFAPELATALVGWGIVLSFFSLTGVYFFL